MNLEKTVKPPKDTSEIEKNDKLCLTKNEDKKLLVISVIVIFCLTILAVIFSIVFYYEQKGQKTDYILEFRSGYSRGFWELKGCIGKIRFQPGFRQGTIFV